MALDIVMIHQCFMMMAIEPRHEGDRGQEVQLIVDNPEVS